MQSRRERAHGALTHGAQHIGYVSDKGIGGEGYNTDEVLNRWSQGQTHYECQHDECYIAPLLRHRGGNIWLTGIRSILQSPLGTFVRRHLVALSPLGNPMLWIAI